MSFALRFLSMLFLLGAAAPAFAQEETFQQWLAAFKREAVAKGIRASVVDDALLGVEPLDDVLELDQKQPESTKTFAQYLKAAVPDARVQRGRAMLQQHRALLNKVSQRYGVPARYIVALWGIETDFGRNTGGFNVPEALATLAYDGRRSEFFRKELLESLRIIQQKNISAEDMTGSWAGAMGQCQFMPTSFFKYAVDFNGDGRRDIWNHYGDLFASIAHYLSAEGWNAQEGWGRQVLLPRSFNPRYADIKVDRPMAEWNRLGVRGMDGKPLPVKNMRAALMFPDDTRSRAYLIYPNYRVFLHWNKSRYFATAVGTLADRIGN